MCPEARTEDSSARQESGRILKCRPKPDIERGFRYRENWYHAAFQPPTSQATIPTL